MKKVCLIIASVAIVGLGMSSCRSHERCAAYGKINKIESGKTFTDKSEKSI